MATVTAVLPAYHGGPDFETFPSFLITYKNVSGQQGCLLLGNQRGKPVFSVFHLANQTTEQNNHLFKNVTFSRVSLSEKRLISWNGQEEATATWRSNLMRIALDSICHKCHCNIVTWLSDGFPGLFFSFFFLRSIETQYPTYFQLQ